MAGPTDEELNEWAGYCEGGLFAAPWRPVPDMNTDSLWEIVAGLPTGAQVSVAERCSPQAAAMIVALPDLIAEVKRSRVRFVDEQSAPTPEQARSLLHAIMADISDSGWAATWLSDIEHELWERVLVGHVGYYGARYISAGDLARLRELFTIAGGWSAYERFFPCEEWFVYHAEWMKQQAKWRADHPESP